MTRNETKSQKLFTVDQANNMLPLVRAIVTDLSQLFKELLDRQQRLDFLNEGRDRETGNLYSDELDDMESQMERDRVRLREFVQELQDLGVECKDPGRGLIDFPSEMDGEIVYLCWQMDEPEVLHWHPLDAGFAGRQSLTADSVAGGDDLGLGLEFDAS